MEPVGRHLMPPQGLAGMTGGDAGMTGRGRRGRMTEEEGQKDLRSQRGWRSQVVENWNSDGYHEWFFCVHTPWAA